MKHILVILIGIVICINSCRLPADPLGDITIITRLDTINTGGDCLDLDVDMVDENMNPGDSILVAAANSNGYLFYKINSIDGIISGLTEQNHHSNQEMDTENGSDEAHSVILSTSHNIAFVMDKGLHHIWVYKYGEDDSYTAPYLDEDCYGGSWRSFTIDDRSDSIGVYTLLNHDSAGGIFIEESTSLAWQGVDPESTSLDAACEHIINQDDIAEKIYFDDGLLSMAYGEQGVRVFKQTKDEICLIAGEIQDLSYDDLCSENYDNSGEIDYKSCCENLAICPDELLEQCGADCCSFFEFGKGGKFSSSRGIVPQIYAEFDTPGEVEAIYSKGNAIFAGLSNSNGCIITTLGSDGSITGSTLFAIGSTIRGIHEDNGLLALAASHDGILLYNWNGSDVVPIGKIETSKAYNVKVAGKIIFAATEDGIEVIQIDYTP